MSEVQTIEQIGSRGALIGPNPHRELMYRVIGTSDESQVEQAVLSTSPSVFRSLPRMSYRIDETGYQIWEATVRYETPPTQETLREVGESSFSFDTSGRNETIFQSLATVGSHAPVGETAPDHRGAIGVTEQGVEGVSIVLPAYQWEETHIRGINEIDEAYRLILFAMTGRTNGSAWREFAQGEALFLGAGGSVRGDQDWQITYRFAASPNRSDIAVGDITIPLKRGWEYLWLQYEEVEDASAHSMTRRPRAAYVERVYPEGNFLDLGIG